MSGDSSAFAGKLAMTEVYNCSIDPWNTKNIAAGEGGFDADQVRSFNDCFLLENDVHCGFYWKMTVLCWKHDDLMLNLTVFY